MSSPAISLRPVGPADEAFLFELYASTRSGELAAVYWTPEQRSAFLSQQFVAQSHAYSGYTSPDFRIVAIDGQPAGRLYLDRQADEWRIIDIALLSASRSRGIGSLLLAEVLSDAADADVAVRMHVEKSNPALTLYLKLGFRVVEDRGLHWFMECLPPSPGHAPLVGVAAGVPDKRSHEEGNHHE